MTLDELFKRLNENTHDGTLNLIPGTLSDGSIAAFYQRITTNGRLTIANVVVSWSDDHQAITVAGTSNDFEIGLLTIQSVFTEVAQTLAYDLTGVFAQTNWQLAGIQWFSLRSPGFHFSVADADAVQILGSISGTIDGSFPYRIELPIPTMQGDWLIKGSFPEDKPNIARLYQLAGGTNLAATLPAPINTFTDLSVSTTELLYNSQKSVLNSIGIGLETTREWPLFSGVSLSNLHIQILVISPASKQRSVSFTVTGGFTLDDAQIVLSLSYPDLSLSGAMDPDSPPVDLTALLERFLPGTTVDLAAQITTFAIFVQLQTPVLYSISCVIDTDWPITILGKEIFRITQLNFNIDGLGSAVTGSIGGQTLVLSTITLGMLAAYLGPQAGWRFQGRQVSGKIAIADLLREYLQWSSPPSFQLDIEGLELTIETGTDSFEFAGKVIGEWNPPILNGISARGTLSARIGYNGGSETLGPDLVRVGRAEMPALVTGEQAILLPPAPGDTKKRGWYGEVSLDITWYGIELTLFYDFDPEYQKFGITWGVLTGYIEKKVINGKEHQVATLQFTQSTTLGSMVEIMVSWLTGSKFALSAPWNVLNGISLSKFALVYDFTDSKVALNIAIGPIELGIARIESITLSYNSGSANPDDNGVIVTLNGSFRWQSDPKQPLSWDAARPETTKGPSGSGNKYLDLRLLALGQHVVVEGIEKVTSVQQAIAALAKLPTPKPGELPAITLAPESSWLIGIDFGVLRLEEGEKGGYLLTLQIVFNDPRLYGLRIALAGKAAKFLSDLDFQILYRQVSETVGVYQAEITLPMVIRRIDVGAYTITLPTFGIALYTNGDFQVDLGFPWNTDFSRSFTIEAIIYPGIPILGSAGLYFGKLSSASTNRVPATTRGMFNPVLVFGFGAQMGFGKSFEYGVLKAGFSLTIVGILEGVLAKWNPYTSSASALILPQVGGSQVQDSYYFWLRGALGIVGKLYGTIDFSIIKADLMVQIILMVQITFESYAPIVLTVIAMVDVSLTVQINLGLFKIKINLTFSLQVKETFSILTSGNAPWKDEAPALPGLLRAPLAYRLLALRETLGLVDMTLPTPNWSYLQPPAARLPLNGYLAPAFTVAGDAAATIDQQQACAVLLLFIRSVPPVTEDTHSSAQKALGLVEDTPFETLCKQILRWEIASIQSKPLTAAEVDRLIVKDEQLLGLFDVLSADNFMLPPDAIETFMEGQFLFTVEVPPRDKDEESDATFFPLALPLELEIPDYGDWKGYQYTIADYNTVSPTFLAELRTYFNDLAVQVEREGGGGQSASSQTNAEISVGGFVFGDYFLLLCRQMLQAARAALRNFTYSIPAATDLGEIIRQINEAGDLNGSFTLFDLFTANPTHPLNAQHPLTIANTFLIQDAAETFASVSIALSSVFSATELAQTNATNGALLRPGAQIHYPDQPAYTIQANDDLLKVASHFAVDLSDLLSWSDLLEQQGLFQLPSSLFLPSVSYQVLASDTLTTVAQMQIYGGTFDASDLARQNAGRTILRPGTVIAYPEQDPYTVLADECLGDVARHFGVSLTELLAKTTILTSTEVLAACAALAIPPFVVQTASGDTLQGLARRFNTTIGVLAASTANLTLVNLFDATADPNLSLPHLPQYRVAELIAEIQRSLGLQQLSGMTSRYYLHGMRLPTDGITPKHRGMWVKDEEGVLKLPEQAGLYALIGQQFPLPTIAGETFVIHLNRPEEIKWLWFAGENPDQLTITIEPSSLDNQSLQAIYTYARDHRLQVDLTDLGRETQIANQYASYPFSSSLRWQSAAAISLPYGKQTDGIAALRLWELPVAMTNLPDPGSRAIDPRFRVQIARYDEASGATIKEDLASYAWASTVQFTVKKVPAPAETPTMPQRPALKTTYEVVGAGGSGIVLLERLLNRVGNDEGFFDNLLLAYPPDQSGEARQGIQTDAPGSVTMGIAQVNLSTDTRPPGILSGVEPVPTLLNSRVEFLRLLWEASITRAGGFYLYYYDAVSNGGLPEQIFNDKGEAVLTLIVLYNKPASSSAQDRLTDFINALATAEPFDTEQAVVFAEANPVRPAEKILASSTDTLAGLAYRYYGDAGELARDNMDVPLTSRVTVTVSQGVYEVPPAGVEPGGDLDRIATYFGTTVPAIKAANPRIATWPNPLPLFMAIRLPRIEVLVGSSPGGTTLGQLARYYGEALTGLAAENQETPGLFATGQTLLIAGGPVVNNPTVAAGVMAFDTRRPIPPPVPDKPTDTDYGRLFLLHAYTLLSYQVSENAEFVESALGLPAGPTTEAAPGSPGKIRVPREPVPGDPWDYRQALPYAKFVKQVYRSVAGLPNPAESPYRALGRLLQIEFAWQDLYGNRLLTTLSNPLAGDQGPLNQRPLLTGYSDLLIGLGQWPSVSAGWQVLPGSPGSLPGLEIVLSFSDSPYQGLLSASALNATILIARFTRPLDPQSAVDLANYQIDNGISIRSARLLSDGESVELTTSALVDGGAYTLTADNIKSLQDELILGGQADFSYPDGQDHSSTVQEHARRDLAVYTQLYYQLSDPNGVALSIQTSLLADEALPLPAPVVAALLAWIGTIYTFLADRAQAGNSVPVPQKEHRAGGEIALDRLNTSQVFELTLALRIDRSGGTIAGDLATVAGIRRVSTEVAPLVQRIGDASDTLGLSLFAQQFQDALSVPGVYRLKVASGVDRFRLSLAQTGSTLWAVRLGLTREDTTGIYYSVDDKGAPAIFAPRPISNKLESHPQVPIYDYVSGRGIDFTTPSRRIDFAAIDMDLWVRQFFAAIDGLLSPEFTAAIQIVDKRKQQTQLTALLAFKKALARLASRWMIPVFTDEQIESGTIQQVFEQQMLQQLSNAYTTRAGIQFQANVRADIHENQTDLEPAQLLGTIIQTEHDESTQSKITLTSPKLVLQTGESRPLAFLLAAPDTVVDSQGQVVSRLTLDLTYAGSQIEHQIGSLSGIDNYKASSWLSFIIPESGRPFDDTLGQFPVPLVLRSYPDSPTMVEQAGDSPEMPGDTLEQLTRWNYRFTYGLPFHYPQDTIYGEIFFNVKDTIQGDFVDAFNHLAEFITVFPAVNQDLRDVLASIDARTTDLQVINTAATALTSFNLMVQHVVEAAEENGNLTSATPSKTSVRADSSYNFRLLEGCIQQDGVAALLITLYGQPPAGVTPEVLVDPNTYIVQPFTCEGVDCDDVALEGDFCFWYKHKETGLPLSAIEGQRIPDRQLLLRGLDLLAYQDAEASVSLRRNENLDPTRQTAEPFIYTTGRITFANPFHPTIDSGERIIEVASIGSGVPPRPIKRSFEQHMQALFAALLQENTQPTLTIQAEIRYDYAIHTGLSPVPLPILFQPPQVIDVMGQGNNSLAQMITNWRDALQDWGKQHSPETQNGVFWLELTLMSELASQPMPLLRLRLLRLPLEYIDPPLWLP